ncbi:DUF4381 domain-containing protein [Alkalimarinus alittae]|uniref:DUF4381 domain-containing protein n=1 Tax=Alkalimarinus alittae TaxID=2961619 RepID=A0ABY6N6G4_9ALTE|nr:DUF4381 domain-containing protein [Alkalimarinus alittae]UZE97579.1 DUF4381 domain-containing protein [Alkalimarinus alittae]
MTPEALLSQLKEIHEPAAIGLWPPAPGWWILIISTLFIITLMAYLIRSYVKKNAWKKDAKQAIAAIGQQINERSPQQTLHLINQLIKRIAIHQLNDPSIKALTGSAWHQFLVSFIEGSHRLSQEQLTLLSEGQYKQNMGADDEIQTEITVLLTALHNWIKEA